MMIPGAKSHEVYPNPARDQIVVEWDPLLYQNLPDISIVNVSGQTKGTYTDVQNGSSLPVADLSNGFYCLAIHHGDRIDYRKFIKE